MPSEAPIRVGPSYAAEFKGGDPRATESVLNLVRTESLVGGRLARLFRRHRLTTASFNVLMILRGAEGPLCPWQIGDRLLVTRGTVTGLLDSLEKQGLIARSTHPEDRRMLLITPTPKAERVVRQILPELAVMEREMFSVLSAKEKETLVALLGKVQAHLAD